MKKTNSQKLAKAYAQLSDFNNGHLSRKKEPNRFLELNKRIDFLKSEILKEQKIAHATCLLNLGFSRVDISNIFDDLNLNCENFQILNEIIHLKEGGDPRYIVKHGHNFQTTKQKQND